MTRCGALDFSIDRSGLAARLAVDGWPSFLLAGLAPSLRINGEALSSSGCRKTQGDALEYAFGGRAALLVHLEPWRDSGIRLGASLRWKGEDKAVLNDVCLLGTSGASTLGSDAKCVRIFEQHGAYNAGVRRLVVKLPEAQGDVRVAVLFSPVWKDGKTVDTTEIKPLASW